ncbi:MAG: undecaprenyldiphospho-muramoylpentapeptide beta-N-acetylglucosaminyltransferase [Rhodobacteraceae bacterium]|nr:undecaprenyldiphospho-muramoylpentapeptide beta-N-acetylglucosaminyltransferase [Paracoccaceae bacterium]
MNSARSPLLILAAGGTGGHIFPAQALAEEMLSRGWRVSLWTDHRGKRFLKRFPEGAEIRQIPTASFSQGSGISRFFVPLKILAGILISLLRILRERPAAVAGFGGYPAFPPLIAAWLAGNPRLIHEQNGVLGRVNRILARRVDLVVCGAVSTRLPEGVKSVNAGNPVRGSILGLAASPYEWPSEGTVNILVLGGSQGAKILDQLVPSAMTKLPPHIRDRLHITQQVRGCHNQAVERYYQEFGVACEIAAFFEDVPKRLAAAHLVIARAGASTLAEIAVMGRPSLLIPFAAAANNHQTANAESFADIGAAISITEADSTAERLSEAVLKMIAEPQVAIRMAAAAAAAARPNAAADFADSVEEIAGGKS